jgi:hypothetical protein
MRLVNWRFPKDHTYFINRQNAWIEKDTFQFYNSVAKVNLQSAVPSVPVIVQLAGIMVIHLKVFANLNLRVILIFADNKIPSNIDSMAFKDITSLILLGVL